MRYLCPQYLPMLAALPLLAIVACLSAAVAQDAAKPADPAIARAHKAASAYRITVDSVPPRPLALRPDPILKWSNPVRKTEDGAVFLWNDRGRPQAVASFYRYRDDTTGLLHEDHEFMSLATKPLTGTLDGRVVWQPSAAGVQLRPIPNAPSPAATEAQRLRQIRALARRFTAFFDNPPDHSEIRLLPQPLYRYELEGSRKDIIDGALFAFVHTTDPEVILLIEALAPAEGAAPSWHYAPARMSMVNMIVKLDGANVWRADWDADLLNPTKPYMTRGTTLAAP